MTMKSIEERIAVLETKNENVEKTLQEVNQKLDDLIALRYKGVGAFWLASALLGTGIVGALTTLWEWFK